MPLVSNESVEKNEGYGITINEAFKLWIKPYFKKENKKFNKEKFRVALIELFDNEKPSKIWLDDQVELEIQFIEKKFKPGDIGKNIPIDLKDIKSISWSKRKVDKNSAKVLIAKFNENWWVLAFDFHYNKGNAKKILIRAKEFLSSCKTMLRKKEYCPHVLIYLIWSTAELILDAKFLLHAQKTKKSHIIRKDKLGGPLGKSFFSPEFSNMLLELYDIKNPARYGNKNYGKKYDLIFFRKQVKILEKEIKQL